MLNHAIKLSFVSKTKRILIYSIMRSPVCEKSEGALL